jgi:cysteine desulfurase / selenocysteine lyase
MNYAGKIGLGVAIDYALEWGLDAIWQRVKTLADALRARLSLVPGVIIRDLGFTQCGIVTLTMNGREPEAIRRKLAESKINVSVSEQRSTRLDMEARGLTSLVRASVHYYNSEEEIERFCTSLEQLAYSGVRNH